MTTDHRRSEGEEVKDQMALVFEAGPGSHSVSPPSQVCESCLT